ncbi:hypothetical protein ONZ45_g2015 [Pleurotus djamor]|nr:hypothetical protein ONZ45_g2015 [Pleurotus djamor]
MLSMAASTLSAPGKRLLGTPSPECRPFHTSFPASDVSQGGTTPFTVISDRSSYSTTKNGLDMYLRKPAGPVTTHDGENDKLGLGCTVNSTFILHYGKVTFDLTAPGDPGYGGLVSAFILVGDDSRDEIDIELLGGDPTHMQSNVYAPQPQDKEPVYGAQSSKDTMPQGSRISTRHSYTIEWSSERIKWSIDGKEIRTLHASSAFVNGIKRYPSHPMRLQLGIWDASSPKGTSEWARGPMAWSRLPDSLTVTVHSITVECP